MCNNNGNSASWQSNEWSHAVVSWSVYQENYITFQFNLLEYRNEKVMAQGQNGISDAFLLAGTFFSVSLCILW